MTKCILTILLTTSLLACGQSSCEEPVGNLRLTNMVKMPVPEEFPTGSCVEFDYKPMDTRGTLRSSCRMLWCGGYQGGMATLWCN